MTKISYYILLLAPISFLLISFVAMIMVGASGHSSGDHTISNLFLVLFSILYIFLIRKRLQKPNSIANNFILLITTLLIFFTSGFYAYMSSFNRTGFVFDYIIMGTTYIFSLCSIIVIIDIVKSLRSNKVITP